MIQNIFDKQMLDGSDSKLLKSFVVDIGSASVRIVVAERRKSQLHILYLNGVVTQLRKYIKINSVISRDAVERLINTIQILLTGAKDSTGEIHQGVGIATEAFRVARNGNQIAERIEKEFGFPVEILSSYQEGELAWVGSQDILEKNDLLVDLGGGSTEFIYLDKTDSLAIYSRRIGAAHKVPDIDLKKKMNRKDLQNLSKYISNALNSIRMKVPLTLNNLVVLGGTSVSVGMLLAAVKDYSYGCVHNLPVTSKSLDDLLQKTARLTLLERESRLGIEPGRGEIIITGMVILKEILKIFRKKHFIVSENGILIGKVKQIMNIV